MFKTTLAFFLGLLALLVGGAAASPQAMQAVPESDDPVVPARFEEIFQSYGLHAPWWSASAFDRGPYIAPAPAYPLPGPALTGGPVNATASLWRNPVRDVLERLKFAWYHGRHIPRRATRTMPRLARELVAC